jgi:hypothetical protein
MKAVALLATMLTLASLPAWAQSTGQETGSGSASSAASSSEKNRGGGVGIFCNVMMLGTFCTSTDASGGSGYGAPSGASPDSPSIPPCSSGLPANDLCN